MDVAPLRQFLNCFINDYSAAVSVNPTKAGTKKIATDGHNKDLSYYIEKNTKKNLRGLNRIAEGEP